MIFKKLRKIPIKIDLTFYLALFGLPLLSALTSGVTIGIASFFTILCIFSLVILHEYGHAYAAIDEGLYVESITLWGLGGVATIKQLDTLTPGKTAYVAIAGPLVNFVLAFIAGIIIYITGSVNYFLYFFFVVNQLLALFNLIPAYPMDGGRLLQSALHWYYGDYDKATYFSARVGVIIGGVLLLASILTGSILLSLIFGFVVYTCYTILTKEISYL